VKDLKRDPERRKDRNDFGLIVVYECTLIGALADSAREDRLKRGVT
jgi:hypothetical protein